MSGSHFRDYPLLSDEQADQLYAMTDPIAERVRKIGGMTLRSIGHIARIQRVKDSDAQYVDPLDMLAELREDNKALAQRLREIHGMVNEHRDIATANPIHATSSKSIAATAELNLQSHSFFVDGKHSNSGYFVVTTVSSN